MTLKAHSMSCVFKETLTYGVLAELTVSFTLIMGYMSAKQIWVYIAPQNRCVHVGCLMVVTVESLELDGKEMVTWVMEHIYFIYTFILQWCPLVTTSYVRLFLS